MVGHGFVFLLACAFHVNWELIILIVPVVLAEGLFDEAESRSYGNFCLKLRWSVLLICECEHYGRILAFFIFIRLPVVLDGERTEAGLIQTLCCVMRAKSTLLLRLFAIIAPVEEEDGAYWNQVDQKPGY